jgi:hypothetical protein
LQSVSTFSSNDSTRVVDPIGSVGNSGGTEEDSTSSNSSAGDSNMAVYTTDQIQGLIDAGFLTEDSYDFEGQLRSLAELERVLTDAGFLTEDSYDFKGQLRSPAELERLMAEAGFLTEDSYDFKGQLRSPAELVRVMTEEGFLTAADLPEDLVRSDAEIQSLIDTALKGIPEDTVRSDDDIKSLINTAILAIPEDTTRSDAEIQSLINNSVTNYLTAADLPEDLVRSDEEIQSLIDTATTGLDTTRSDAEIQNIVNTSLAGIDFSPYLTAADLPDYQGMLDLALSTIPEDTQMSETDLTKAVSNYLTTNNFVTSEDLPDFETIVDESIGGIDYSQFATTETTADFLTSAEIKQLIEDAQLSSPNVYTMFTHKESF